MRESDSRVPQIIFSTETNTDDIGELWENGGSAAWPYRRVRISVLVSLVESAGANLMVVDNLQIR